MSLVIGEAFRFKPDPALFEVYVQNFNDDYHLDDDDFLEEERAVRHIKGGRYRNLYKYLDEKEIYDEYMQNLKKRYPKSIYKSLVLSGDLGIFIPERMEYKAKAKEKIVEAAYKKGIYISKSDKEVDQDLADEFIEEFWKENYEVDIDSESLLKVPKDDRKLINKIIEKDYFDDTGYKIKAKKKDKQLNDVDLLSELYLIKSDYDDKGKKKKKDNHKFDRRIGIKLNRYISGKYIKDLEKAEKNELNTIQYMNGMLLSGRDQQNMEIYNLMLAGGHKNIYRIIKNRKTKHSKHMSKIYKQQMKMEKNKKEFNSLLSVALNDSGGSSYEDFLGSIAELYSDD